jgi:hypothetical protein
MSDEDDWVLPPGSLSAPHPIKLVDPQVEEEDLEDCYSPLADLHDEFWVGKRYPKTSELVLACPGCFVTVCRQVIESYDNQHTTEAVENCTFGDRLSLDDTSHRVVLCEVCNAELGVFEVEGGLYYLFHVLPGR